RWRPGWPAAAPRPTGPAPPETGPRSPHPQPRQSSRPPLQCSRHTCHLPVWAVLLCSPWRGCDYKWANHAARARKDHVTWPLCSRPDARGRRLIRSAVSLLGALVALAALAPGGSAVLAAPGPSVTELRAAGAAEIQNMYVRAPANVPEDQPLRVLIALHGMG